MPVMLNGFVSNLWSSRVVSTKASFVSAILSRISLISLTWLSINHQRNLNASYWPARTLFPRESSGRSEYSKKEKVPGEYSIKYFGSVPSFYDKASRTFPIHLTTVKLFTVSSYCINPITVYLKCSCL